MHLQANDEICHKLEFYVSVYFAIYPMHSLNPHVTLVATALTGR
jgi:hypothetical protein